MTAIAHSQMIILSCSEERFYSRLQAWSGATDPLRFKDDCESRKNANNFSDFAFCYLALQLLSDKPLTKRFLFLEYPLPYPPIAPDKPNYEC